MLHRAAIPLVTHSAASCLAPGDLLVLHLKIDIFCHLSIFFLTSALFIVTLFFVPDPGKRALDGLIGGVAVGGGVLLLALLMEKLLRRDAMGGGDIKLLFLTGLFLGWQKNLLCLLLACVVGILWGLVRAKRGQQGLPWGPGIALAAWCAALFGQNLIDWYLSLL